MALLAGSSQVLYVGLQCDLWNAVMVTQCLHIPSGYEPVERLMDTWEFESLWGRGVLGLNPINKCPKLRYSTIV